MKLRLFVQCDHAPTCKAKDCPHHQPHPTKDWCDCLVRSCGAAKKEGAICEEVQERESEVNMTEQQKKGKV